MNILVSAWKNHVEIILDYLGKIPNFEILPYQDSTQIEFHNLLKKLDLHLTFLCGSLFYELKEGDDLHKLFITCSGLKGKLQPFIAEDSFGPLELVMLSDAFAPYLSKMENAKLMLNLTVLEGLAGQHGAASKTPVHDPAAHSQPHQSITVWPESPAETIQGRRQLGGITREDIRRIKAHMLGSFEVANEVDKNDCGHVTGHLPESSDQTVHIPNKVGGIRAFVLGGRGGRTSLFVQKVDRPTDSLSGTDEH